MNEKAEKVECKVLWSGRTLYSTKRGGLLKRGERVMVEWPDGSTIVYTVRRQPDGRLHVTVPLHGMGVDVDLAGLFVRRAEPK